MKDKNSKFERILSNPFFKYCKRFCDLILLNLLFFIVSILSLLSLFAAGLVSAHKICNSMVNDNDYNVFLDFFIEIKKQWSFSWRLEILSLIIFIISGAILFIDYFVLFNMPFNIIPLISIALITAADLVFVTIIMNLLMYNSYIFDDTFSMMLKKSALVTRKKLAHSILMLLIFVAFIVLCYFIPLVSPFISIAFIVYINEASGRKMFTLLAREELERSLLPENLFLPVIKEDKNEIK